MSFGLDPHSSSSLSFPSLSEKRPERRLPCFLYIALVDEELSCSPVYLVTQVDCRIEDLQKNPFQTTVHLILPAW